MAGDYDPFFNFVWCDRQIAADGTIPTDASCSTEFPTGGSDLGELTSGSFTLDWDTEAFADAYAAGDTRLDNWDEVPKFNEILIVNKPGADHIAYHVDFNGDTIDMLGNTTNPASPYNGDSSEITLAGVGGNTIVKTSGGSAVPELNPNAVWINWNNPAGVTQAMSHLSVYGRYVSPAVNIPIPGTLWLLLFGAFGIAFPSIWRRVRG